MITLISFIGRPSAPHEKNPSSGIGPPATKDYVATEYRFSEDSIYKTLFFGWSAVQHLQKTKKTLDKWIIVGTKTSGWEMLSEIVFDADNQLCDSVTEWAAKTKEQTKSKHGIQEDQLRIFEEKFGNAIGVNTQLQIVTDDANSIFHCLETNLKPENRVILDITHGYRTMPVHAMVALGALQWIKKIKIEDILYGGLEKRVEGGPAPAVSLLDSVILARITPKLAAVQLTENLEAAKECCEGLQVGTLDLRAGLSKAHIYKSILQGDLSDNLLRQNLFTDTSSWKGDEGNEHIKESVTAMLREIADPGTSAQTSQRLFNRAYTFFELGDYLRSILLLNECIKYHVIKKIDVNNELKPRLGNSKIDMGDIINFLIDKNIEPLTTINIDNFNSLRNCIAHVLEPKQEIKKYIQNPAELKNFIKLVLEQTRQAFFTKNS